MEKLILILIVFTISFWSCKKEEKETEELPDSSIIYYISNEGAFGFENSSLSAYYPLENNIINNAFEKVNNRGLGDVLQSTYHHNNKLYLLVNASSKIEIAETPSLKEIGVIPNISMPRYMLSNSNTGYISQWGDGGNITILDLETNKIIHTVSVGNGPERMLLTDQYLMVCNSGGFTSDSTISILDLNTNQIIKTLKVGDIPMDIVRDKDNEIWVLCKGQTIYNSSWQIIGHTPSKLLKISEANLSIIKEIELFEDQHPSHIALSSEGDKLFIGGGFGFQGIYQFDLTTEKLDSIAISSKSFYGISCGVESNIFGFESPDFTSSGKMIEMDLEGNIIKEVELGIGPNGMSW